VKKVLSIITIVLEVLFLVGAGIIRYFTERKMGMARHMVYMTRKWNEVVPLEVFCVAYIVYFIYGFVQSQRDFFEVGLLLSIALLLQIIRLWILMLGKK